MKTDLKEDDTLTSSFECVDINGSVIIAKDQLVTVREIESTPAHYSRICPDIWVEEKINCIKLVGIYGSWKASTFKELQP